MLDLEEFKEAAKKAGAFGLDVETTGTDVRKDRLICITFAVNDRTWYVPFDPLPNSVSLVEARDWLNDNVFCDPELSAIIHNAKFDYAVLTNHGFVIRCKLIDTQVAEWVCSETGAAPSKAKEGIFGLKELVKKYFKEDRPSFLEVADCLFIAPKDFEKYARDDARDHWRLWFDVEKPALEKEGKKVRRIFYDMEMMILRVIIEMEASGLYVNIEEMERILKKAEKDIASLHTKICKLAGRQFNINSSDQLSEVLFKDLKINPNGISLLKKSTAEKPIYSTGKDSMKALRGAHKIIPAVEEYRKETKKITGFLKPILHKANENSERRIYPEFKQTGTRIGRLSSANPNGQNMPRKGGIRDCMIAPEGKVLICGDLNQIEYRILAHQSRDPNLINAYKSGSDMHKMTMEAVGCERTIAKCLTAETLVFTEDGVSEIGRVIGDIEPDEHQIIPTVKLADGRDGWVTSSWAIKRYDRPCVYVVTKRGIVCCTEDHRWLLEDGSLVEAGKLKKGMKLPIGVVPKIEGSPKTIRVNPFTKEVGSGPCELTLDEKWAYFAGMFHGDGSVSSHASSISHGSGDKYSKWRDTVVGACKDVGLPANTDSALKNTYLGSRVVSSYLGQLDIIEYLSEKGYGRKRMRIPGWVLLGGEKVVLSYLAGLFDTDGTVDNTLSFTTKYFEYAGQVATILRALGCPISVEPCWNKTYKRWYFRVHVLSAGIKYLANSCPLRSYKLDKLKKRAEKVTKRAKSNLDDVVSLVVPAGNKTVFDFHVDNKDHLYLQGGLIGHNNVNFGIVYGMSVGSLAAFIEIPVSRAKKIYNGVFKRFPNIKKYKKKVEIEVMKNRYVETIFGRRRRFFDVELGDYEHRQAFHFTISGSAADVIKIGMIKLYQRLEELRAVDPRYKEAKMVAQVHDEIVVEAPEEIGEDCRKLMLECMEDVGGGQIRVPVKAEVGIGTTWGESKV